MELSNRELLFRQIAERYAQADGERLLRELAELEQGAAVQIHPRMDSRVRAIAQRARRRRHMRAAGLVAACLVAVLLAPQLLRDSRPMDMEMSAAPTENAAAPEDVQAEYDEAAPEMEADGEPLLPGQAGDYAVIPLSFALPDNLAVVGVEQDNAQSVYFLSDQLLDDVVLSLEYTDAGPETAGLVEIDIDGSPAYGVSTGDYNLLTFHSGGILYTLTCRHDINTLLALGRNIL